MDVSGSPSQSPILPKRKRAVSAIPPVRETPDLGRERLGRYAVTGQLGRGGMGIVYEAEDTRLKRKVAIKLLPKEVSSNPEALARFLREAQGAAKLNHANVVAVYDIGETADTHYIVMELINGGNAQEMLRQRGSFHWWEATSILMDVCRGVAAAHKAGLIHRDIKPSNILRSSEGVVKLGDFGLVKPAGIKGTEVTALGEMVGTPHYMSPEQSRCDALDERSDIYSLGATYFALLTGRPPFNSPDCMQVLFAHCAHPVPDPREIAPDVPEVCTAIIRKAMAKNRAQRHASAAELLADLEKVVALQPANSSGTRTDTRLPAFVWSGADPTETGAVISLADAYPGERSETVPGSKSRRGRFVALGVLSSLLATVLAVLLLGQKGPSPDAQTESSPVADTDWPSLAAEADRAIRSRDVAAMKRALAKVWVMRQRAEQPDGGVPEAIRQTLARLEKALAFRESITERGLVLGFDGPVTGAVLSPDDQLLAIGQSFGDGGAVVLDGYTGEKRFALWPRKGGTIVRVQSLAFDHTSTAVAAVCADDSIKLVRIASGKQSSFDLGPGVKRPLTVMFAPNTNKLVAGLEPYGEGKGKTYLKVWNTDTGKEPFPFKIEHSAKVSALAFTAGGHQVATGSDDKRVVMWNAETGRIWRELRTGLTIRALACSPDGRKVVVAGLDQGSSVLQFWDYAAGTLLSTQPSHHGTCHCVAISRDGKLLASGSGSRVLLWNPETQNLVATLAGHSHDVTSVAFCAEGGILVTGGADQTTRLWDVTRHLSPRPKP